MQACGQSAPTAACLSRCCIQGLPIHPHPCCLPALPPCSLTVPSTTPTFLIIVSCSPTAPPTTPSMASMPRSAPPPPTAPTACRSRFAGGPRCAWRALVMRELTLHFCGLAAKLGCPCGGGLDAGSLDAAALPPHAPMLPPWLCMLTRLLRPALPCISCTHCSVAEFPPAVHCSLLFALHCSPQEVDTCWPVRSPIRYYLSAYGKVRPARQPASLPVGQQVTSSLLRLIGHVITAAIAAAAAAGGGPRPGSDDERGPANATQRIPHPIVCTMHTCPRWRPPARRR